MNDDRGHGAMPKLYGQPAYARPPILPVNPVEKPFDPDALPLEAERTIEDLELVEEVQSRVYETVATADTAAADHDGSRKRNGRPFRIKLPGRGHDGR